MIKKMIFFAPGHLVVAVYSGIHSDIWKCFIKTSVVEQTRSRSRNGEQTREDAEVHIYTHTYILILKRRKTDQRRCRSP